MKSIFGRFFGSLLAYKWRFSSFLFVAALSVVLENLNPYFYKLLVDAAPLRDLSLMLKILLFFIFSRVLANWFGNLSQAIGDKMVLLSARDTRVRIFRHIQELDFAFHVNKSTGSLISAFKRGDGAYFGLFDTLFHQIFRNTLSLLIILLFFAGVSSTIVWLLLGVFLVNSIAGWLLIRNNLKKRQAANKSEDEISSIITDNLLNYETVKFFAQEEAEENRLKKQFIGWADKYWAYFKTFRYIELTVSGISNLGVLLIFYVILRKLVAGEISAGDFIMVATFINGFYFRFFGLIYEVRNIAKNYVDLEKYFGLLDDQILVKDPLLPAKTGKITGEIEFKNVNFQYPDSRGPVLKNINLLIKAGESVAFVGKSGVGKTTLVKLLLRFYDTTKGEITIDGVDIKSMSKTTLRRLIGVVPQEAVLFNNTIRFNIGYGRKSARLIEIKKAAKMANLEDFIESLPQKYETMVGERGVKLSGGQKQRLAIARALITDPKIIVFDEATSNLDSESERLIQKALWKIAEQKTVLIVAHRFSTIRKADRIVVMAYGQIAEEGSHHDLASKKKGLYRYLWRLQSKGELE